MPIRRMLCDAYISEIVKLNTNFKRALKGSEKFKIILYLSMGQQVFIIETH